MDVAVQGNFSVQDQSVPNPFPHGGWWYEYFTGYSINVVNGNWGMLLEPGEYRLYTDVRLPAPDLSIITAVDEGFAANEVPMELWPNPSDGRARLGYELDGPQEVSIEVYDMMGRKVADLGRHQQSFGYHTVEIDGTTWEAGRYIIRVSAGQRQGWRMMDVQ